MPGVSQTLSRAPSNSNTAFTGAGPAIGTSPATEWRTATAGAASLTAPARTDEPQPLRRAARGRRLCFGIRLAKYWGAANIALLGVATAASSATPSEDPAESVNSAGPLCVGDSIRLAYLSGGGAGSVPLAPTSCTASVCRRLEVRPLWSSRPSVSAWL